MFKKRKNVKNTHTKVEDCSNQKGCQNDDHNKIINLKTKEINCVCQPNEEKDKDEQLFVSKGKAQSDQNGVCLFNKRS